MKNTPITSAELFVATGCHHCPAVLSSLSEQLKKGQLSNLSVTNIVTDNKRAEKLNIRSVPWFSLSNTNVFMIFSGSYNEKEILHWLDISKTETGMQEYIKDSLNSGSLMALVQVIQIKPEMYSHVLSMLGDEETSMDVRIGLDALTENFAASDMLKQFSDGFKKIASKNNIRLQIDALHYLALTGDINNKKFLKEKAQDSNEQIKEAAIEALETLADLLD